MRRNALFWGFFLVVMGALLLMWNFDIITFNVWGAIGSLFLVLLGIWFLFGMLRGRQELEIEHVSVPLEGASQARIVIEHGIGIANLSGPVEPGTLMSGDFGGGLKWRTTHDGSQQRLTMKMADFFVPPFFPMGPELRWDFGLSRDVPLTLKVKAGAGMLDLDLGDLRVVDLDFDGGVGTSKLTLPANAGHVRAKISGGVGTLTLQIPEGVAASIRTTGGIGTISVNRERFPRVGEHRYESPDYATAENKIEMRVDGGVGTVTIR
jgi:hypothetical protein